MMKRIERIILIMTDWADGAFGTAATVTPSLIWQIC